MSVRIRELFRLEGTSMKSSTPSSLNLTVFTNFVPDASWMGEKEGKGRRRKEKIKRERKGRKETYKQNKLFQTLSHHWATSMPFFLAFLTAKQPVSTERTENVLALNTTHITQKRKHGSKVLLESKKKALQIPVLTCPQDNCSYIKQLYKSYKTFFFLVILQYWPKPARYLLLSSLQKRPRILTSSPKQMQKDKGRNKT